MPGISKIFMNNMIRDSETTKDGTLTALLNKW
jgi:hypothetical protein